MPDIVVIGAGLAGLSTAHHLAPDARVVVLDQADQPGAEASSDNAGMVRRLDLDPHLRALAVRSAAWMADPDGWTGAPPAHTVGAVLGLALDPHHLTDGVAHLRARGIRVEDLGTDARHVAPAMAGAPLAQAWWLPDEQVADPWALMQGYLATIRSRGGEVRCRTRVTALVVEGGRVIGVGTDAGIVSAGAVVLAAGAWCGHLTAPLGLHRPLVPLRRTLLQSDPHPRSHPDHPWMWIDDLGLYARPESGGWLVSGCDEAPEAPPIGAGSRGGVDPELRALAASKLDRWLPAIADARLAAGWTGLRTVAPDRRPILGADPDLPGLWWAAGLGGAGVTCSYAAGEAVAAWWRGEATPWLRASALSAGRSFLTRWTYLPQGDVRRSRWLSSPAP